jgi:hypothetical protein
MTTATDTGQPEMGLTFEKVWATIQETSKKMRESREETERMMRESREETERMMRASREETDRKMRESREETERVMQEAWRKMQESSAETDRIFRESERRMDKMFKETNKKLGELGGRFGELAEHLVAPGILKKFNALGYGFDKCSPNVSIESKALDLALEIDLFLENGDCAMAVEVKAKLKTDDIKDHITRMEKLRCYANAHKDARKFYGAVAGAVIPKEVKEFSLKNGIYVVAQSGDTMTIDVPKGFKPKNW